MEPLDGRSLTAVDELEVLTCVEPDKSVDGLAEYA